MPFAGGVMADSGFSGRTFRVRNDKTVLNVISFKKTCVAIGIEMNLKQQLLLYI